MNDNTNPKSPGIILWFSGLSGAGKTTVAEGVLSSFQKKKSQHVLLMAIGLGKQSITVWGLAKAILKLIMH